MLVVGRLVTAPMGHSAKSCALKVEISRKSFIEMSKMRFFVPVLSKVPERLFRQSLVLTP